MPAEQAGERRIHGRTLELSNVDKVLFPDDGITKGELIEYHERIAEVMLPHLQGRPVAIKRLPDGLGGTSFFQKEAGSHFPDWVGTVDVPKRKGGTTAHIVVEEAATLPYLANLGTIELHSWTSRRDDLERPDQLVFDLDPPDDRPDAARAASHRVREVLDELGLDTLLKTSGSKGYHVHVPLDRSADFEVARRFAADVARVVAGRHPDDLTDEQRKSARRGRVFVDHLRNAYGQTAVAPYSVRARPGAPVATPIEWRELDDLDPGRYDLRNLFRRLGQREDPWRDAWHDGHALAAARDTLSELLQQIDGGS